MPVFEQGYRRYTGEKSKKSRVLAIAWQNVRPAMTWKFWALLLVMLGPYLMYGVLLFVATLGASMFGGRAVVALPPPTVAFQNTGGPPNPAAILGFVQGNPLTLFWELLDQASAAAVIFPAIIGAGLLASDRRTGALQIYFSRPVSRLDYLLAKVLAATSFVAMVTVIPSLLLWIESVAFGSSVNFTWRTWIAPLVIVAGSSLYALWSVALVLSLSAAMRRPAVVAIVSIVAYFVLDGIGNVLVHALRNEGWNLIRPSYAIGTLTASFCGLDLPPWADQPTALAVAVALPLGLLGLVWWRLRAVEVST